MLSLRMMEGGGSQAKDEQFIKKEFRLPIFRPAPSVMARMAKVSGKFLAWRDSRTII
jgi:hypothetical protein